LTNGGGGPRSRPTLERPKQAGHGDYATNAALVLAPVVGAPPRDVAARLGDALAERLGPALERVEVAGPGFLNLFLADAWYAAAVDWVLEAGDAFGTLAPERAERVNLEFVSANPTGPLTAASGRHAAYGDALGRILTLAGHTVETEYYFNDEGGQIRRLAESIRARARGEEPPEEGYQGEYVKELADEIPGAADADLDELARRGVELVVARIRATLDAYRVAYDRWFTERTLHEGSPSAIDRALARLEEQGHLYRSDGALWLRTTTFGDDKDRVLIRSTGEPTYFAADVAYHEEKLERGYDRMVNVLGSDHHGYVARMKAAMAALGADPDRLEVPLLQFVHIVDDGSRASMSKRRGDFITLDELIGEIGVDATRWFMLSRSHDSTVDLDLDLARRESSENPV
jgi:arginyl-tRNA synthetase